MLKYLIILLDDTAVPFCYYRPTKQERRPINLDNLKKGIFFAMTENLSIQFVYPDYALSEEYCNIIDSIDHIDIKPATFTDADVSVFDTKTLQAGLSFDRERSYVWYTSKEEFFENIALVVDIQEKVSRLNISITDIDTFTNEDFNQYKEALQTLSSHLIQLYETGKIPQLNLLTDRLQLNRMNNCNAGVESLTLAPDGKFYICPAFYYNSEYEAVGDPVTGPIVKNNHLFRLDHAPLCRRCDAYQCRRCVWLNYKTTLEVNTPSHEQCVVAHLERNASRTLLSTLRQQSVYFPNKEIPEINYLDPFDNQKE